MKNKIIQLRYVTHVLYHKLYCCWKTKGLKYFAVLTAVVLLWEKDFNFHIELKNNSDYKIINPIKNDSLFGVKNSYKPNKNKILIDDRKVTKKEKRYLNYIENHFLLAQQEMELYDIPASIKLAQGLLETNGGASKLAVNCNNHFGIKCFSRKCKKGHCLNFSDDSHKDFFKKYKSVKESYRAHSVFLKKERYKKLFSFREKDYKSWAYELKRAGYATDKKYPEKLIALIEKYKLYQFDVP